MRTPHLPKRAPWTAEYEASFQKVRATFPAWNSEQIAVMRRIFATGAAAATTERQGEAA